MNNSLSTHEQYEPGLINTYGFEIECQIVVL